MAELGVPDMAVPIRFCRLTYPRRMPSPCWGAESLGAAKADVLSPGRGCVPLPGAVPGGAAPGRFGASGG